MKLLLDMNLSPAWVPYLQRAGLEARHWTEVGDPRAQDSSILAWARDNGHVVITHDLDFARLIALTRLEGPSVLLLRARDLLPEGHSDRMLDALHACRAMLGEGALVVLDEVGWRVRALPIRRRDS